MNYKDICQPTSINQLEEVVVLDFETTGIDPNYDRVIEAGAAIVKNGTVVDTFSELMNPGCYIPYEITQITGISSQMLRGKPSPEKTMPALHKFIGNRPIVAHNASFDYKFLVAEARRVGIETDSPLLCTLLLSRRMIQGLYNYKLGTIAQHLNIDMKRSHRALDDVLATAEIWSHLYRAVCDKTGILQPDIKLLNQISKKPKAGVLKFLEKIKEKQTQK